MNSVTLHLPDHLYERVQQIATNSNRTVENVLVEGLTLLLDSDGEPLDSLDDLADFTLIQLWAVVHRRLVWHQSQRLHDLVTKSKYTTLSPDEISERDSLLERNQQLMLQRSEALALLHERGEDVSQFFERGA